MQHQAIITKLGGIRALARKLDHANHTTVQGWFDRDRIPLDRWSEVIAASDGGIAVGDLMPADLKDTAA